MFLARFFISLFLLALSLSVNAQKNLYDVSFKKDAKIVGLGVVLNTAGYFMLNNVDIPNLDEINNLDPSNLSGLDNGAINNYSQDAQKYSDIILYTAVTIPFAAYAFKDCREEDWSIFLMGIETFILNTGVTFMTKAIAKRYRPLNYNPNVPIETKLDSGSRLSFFSGHASSTAAMCFFLAQVLTDLNPEMKNKYLIWSAAAITPLSIGYLRYLAGKHFPTDILTGYAVGATIGYFIPKIHLNDNVSLNTGPTGFSVVFNIDK